MLGWCAKQTQGFILVRARMSLCLVGVVAAHVPLHQSAHSRGYKLSREGADPKSLWWCLSLTACSVRCCLLVGPPRCGPCLPFYSSQGEGLGYNFSKKEKRWKRMIKNGGHRCSRLPPYPAWAIYSVAHGRNGPFFILCAFVLLRTGSACS